MLYIRPLDQVKEVEERLQATEQRSLMDGCTTVDDVNPALPKMDYTTMFLGFWYLRS